MATLRLPGVWFPPPRSVGSGGPRYGYRPLRCAESFRTRRGLPTWGAGGGPGRVARRPRSAGYRWQEQEEDEEKEDATDTLYVSTAAIYAGVVLRRQERMRAGGTFYHAMR